MKNFVFILFIFCSVACFSQSYPYGKVRVVNSFADYKVRVVTSFPDLQVEKVNAYADSPGKWQFVDDFEDFTVEFVNAFEDFTIEWVDHVSASYPAPNSHNVTVYGGGNGRNPLSYGIDKRTCSIVVKHGDSVYKVPMAARVKIVESDGDLKVLDSKYYAWTDAGVQIVDSTYNKPLECCQWQIVESDYDFTVQYVKHWFEADAVILFRNSNQYIGLSEDH